MDDVRLPGGPRPWWLIRLRHPGALVLVATIAAGCSSEPAKPSAVGTTGNEPSERSSRLEEFATDAEKQADDLNGTGSELGEFRAAAKEVAGMKGRSIAAGDYGRVMTSCLRDAGLDDAKLTQDGEGLDAAFHDDLEREGHNLVLSACETRFPVE